MTHLYKTLYPEIGLTVKSRVDEYGEPSEDGPRTLVCSTDVYRPPVVRRPTKPFLGTFESDEVTVSEVDHIKYIVFEVFFGHCDNILWSNASDPVGLDYDDILREKRIASDDDDTTQKPGWDVPLVLNPDISVTYLVDSRGRIRCTFIIEPNVTTLTEAGRQYLATHTPKIMQQRTAHRRAVYSLKRSVHKRKRAVADTMRSLKQQEDQLRRKTALYNKAKAMRLAYHKQCIDDLSVDLSCDEDYSDSEMDDSVSYSEGSEYFLADDD